MKNSKENLINLVKSLGDVKIYNVSELGLYADFDRIKDEKNYTIKIYIIHNDIDDIIILTTWEQWENDKIVKSGKFELNASIENFDEKMNETISILK